ncbi:histidine phosphatase family protein [Porphyromonas sp. COT-290 OH860]|uniref:histidine phosphatase family protein n=1 Tax=Porphyromonas sp. COT-290 OH860 TaxID=1515615 RepID=UPI00052D5E3C|nr:histidine phosphatase family protein [Porphyromonas sp. COT-290 OH860]KGN84653.1 phosphoglycerate kinase [Porphyromonas sp. COT-290 OH860]
MIVYIVRHTSVVLDGNEICYGFTDIALRDTFEQEAAVTKSKLHGLSFDEVFTSPLSRASKLADFCGHPDAERDDRLKEMNFGEWELRPWADIIVGQSTEEFFLEYITKPAPGGESQLMQYERVCDFILEKQAEGLDQILVFCHGGVINCAKTMAGLCDLNEAFATIPDFGSVTRLEF